MATTLVRGRYVLVRADPAGDSRLLRDGAVLQRDGVVLEVGPYADLRANNPDVEVVGNGREFLMPGLVNAHSHGRGVSGPLVGQPDGPLETWIHRGWGRRSADPYLMALYAQMQQVRNGVTTVMHNQSAGPAARVRAEAEETLRAFRDTGMRVAFSIAFRNQCYLVYGDDEAFLSSLPSDLARGVRSVVDVTKMPYDDYRGLTLDLAGSYGAARSDAIRVLFSPQGYHWADEATLGRIADDARSSGLGVHLHLVESYYQRLYAERLYGQTPARRLYGLGFLGPHVSLAHAVWLTDEDVALLAQTGAMVVHNPSSNLRLRSGIAPVLSLLRAGVTLGLGADSASLNDDDDLFQDIGLALRLHRPPGLEEASISSHQVLWMATVGGAKAALFGDDLIGTLEPGRRADMLLLDWDRVSGPYLGDDVDPLDALAARARGRDVRMVMIDGRVVYLDGEFVDLDEEAVRREVHDQMGGPPPDALLERARLARDLEPHLRRFYADWRLPETPPHYFYNSHR